MSGERIYIVGPCAAESREQVVECARAIDDLRSQIDDFKYIYRAGAWKPRTSPNTFQGVGEEALAWLQEVKAIYGVEVATEVATAEHVEAALKAGIDYLWIGARSSANPLAVQEIATQIINESLEHKKSLKGILIKNPVNEDAGLWLGNIERLERTGVPVMAVHRGCGHKPCWRMAHQVRKERPDIPVLLDPSHMSGDAERVPELMKKIAELGLDGAMIEVHSHPEQALSDAKQQITPVAFSAALTTNSQQPTANNQQPTELNWLRAEIDELDEALWDTIAARMEVSKRIGEWKKERGIPPLQPARFREIGERLKGRGESLGLSQEFMMKVWEMIHEESLKQQER